MDLEDIVAALKGRRARPTVRRLLSKGGEASWRAPKAMHRNKWIEPTPETMAALVRNWAVARKSPIHPKSTTKTLLLRFASESWTRPGGILSACGFDIIVMDAEWAFGKSVEDFGAVEWRAVAMFLGSVIDNPRKRKGRPRKPDWKPFGGGLVFGEGLVYQKPLGAPPVEYDEADRRVIVQEIEVVKSELPGRPTDKAAIKEFFKRRAASEGRRLSAYAEAEAKLARRLPEWRRRIRKIDEKSR
jgi:hypothetical protein